MKQIFQQQKFQLLINYGVDLLWICDLIPH